MQFEYYKSYNFTYQNMPFSLTTDSYEDNLA